jgi:hypothetical protein
MSISHQFIIFINIIPKEYIYLISIFAAISSFVTIIIILIYYPFFGLIENTLIFGIFFSKTVTSILITIYVFLNPKKDETFGLYFLFSIIFLLFALILVGMILFFFCFILIFIISYFLELYFIKNNTVYIEEKSSEKVIEIETTKKKIINFIKKFFINFIFNISWKLSMNFSKRRRIRIMKAFGVLMKNKLYSKELLTIGSLI